MKRHMLFLIMALLALSWGIDRGWAQPPENGSEMKYRGGKLTAAERKEAAKRAQALGVKPGVAGMYTDTDTNTDPDKDKETVRKKSRPSTQTEKGRSIRKK
jgi:arabinogalactan endo-1,4-beta-galactosidase